MLWYPLPMLKIYNASYIYYRFSVLAVNDIGTQSKFFFLSLSLSLSLCWKASKFYYKFYRQNSSKFDTESIAGCILLTECWQKYSKIYEIWWHINDWEQTLAYLLYNLTLINGRNRIESIAILFSLYC